MVRPTNYRWGCLPDWRMMSKLLHEHLLIKIEDLQKANRKHREVIIRLRFTIKAILIAVLIFTLAVLSIQLPQRYQLVKRPIIKQASMEQKKLNRTLARDMARIGWGWTGSQWVCLDKIFKAESKYDQFAKNKTSTAYGIGQMLGEKSSEPAVQLTRSYNYIKTRYTTPCHAYRFHLRQNYY